MQISLFKGAWNFVGANGITYFTYGFWKTKSDGGYKSDTYFTEFGRTHTGVFTGCRKSI